MLNMEITQLIERCKQGDEDALGALYTAYARRMKGVCLRYINDKHAADDIVHDAFVIIFSSFDKLRDSQRAEAWMMHIVKNIALKYRQQLNATPIVPLEEAPEKEIFTKVNDDAETITISLDEIMRMVKQLPKGYGQIFRLSVLEGRSHKEIAELLGIEAHSSSSQLTRAKKMLWKMIQKHWTLLLLAVLASFTIFFFKKEKLETKMVEEKPVVTVQENILEKNDFNTEEALTPSKSWHALRTQTEVTIKRITIDTMKRQVRGQEQEENPQKESADFVPNIRQERIPRIQKYGITQTRLPRKPTSDYSKHWRWSLHFAYSCQYDQHYLHNQPSGYLTAPVGTTSISTYIDNWSDYAIYLANHPNVGNPATRKAIAQIALNNAEKPGEDKILQTSHHYMPITMTLAVNYRLNNRWSLETGLNYSHLTSEFEKGKDGNTINDRQTISYLGIPFKGIYNIYNMYGTKRWKLYASAGLTLEIPIRPIQKSDYFIRGKWSGSDITTLSAPWQYSTNFGIGLQYHIAPRIGLFAEPTLQYYIPGGNIKTYRTERPFIPTLPIGIRLSW